jgi:protein-tyrosine phosphatase
MPAAGMAGQPPKGPIARWRALVRTNHGTWRGWVRAALAEGEYLLGRVDDHVTPDLARVNRLVFVCLGNINRSAFAEQVARRLGVRTCSIGLSTTTGAPAFRTAQATSPLFGIDLTAHRATNLTDHTAAADDLLLVMEVRHARRLVQHGMPPRSIALLGHWAAPRRLHLHDPHVLDEAYFRTCFTLIESAVRGLVAELEAADSPCLRR